MESSEYRTSSNTQLLEEIEALSHTLYQNHSAATSTNRRTASLALPRSPIPSVDLNPPVVSDERATSRSHRSRRMSLSPWRSRPKLEDVNVQESGTKPDAARKQKEERSSLVFEDDKSGKKGIWKWKPIRALSHIGMQKLSILFSVEVVSVQGLPASMNGLRLSVCVRKKETKDGAVHTMPSRVQQGAADFEEMLFVRCHVYCTPGTGKGSQQQQQQLKFEPRPFLIYVFAVDTDELDFGRHSVDLSRLIQESMERSLEGARIRQWDTSFNLSGKAKVGELVIKLGFQIMEDGGMDIYSQAEGIKSSKWSNLSSSIGRRQSKTSFSVPSPRITSKAETWTPSQAKASGDFQGIDHLNLDEPPSAETEMKGDDLDIPEFEVVDKGVEIQDKEDVRNEGGGGEAEEEESFSEEKSSSSEVVKEVVHDQVHLARLTELDSIAQQIKALESMMGDEQMATMAEDESDSQRLDADEETVTREFLQMLESEEDEKSKLDQPEVPYLQLDGGEDSAEADSKVYVSDLGKGLGCVVRTRDGGYLAAMNPVDSIVARKDTPKLAMQLSKALVIPMQESLSGFEVLQGMAAVGFEELSSQILSLMPMDELIGKTAEQVAFEGIASAIIQGRNKEGASSSAARTIAAVKTMCTALSAGRKDRISTGIWNVSETSLPVEEILAFSLQKVEAMAVEALKIQADMAEEYAPFDVSPLSGKTGAKEENPLAKAVSLEDWINAESGETETITVAVVIQIRDPMRRYEAVGGPMLALIQAVRADAEDAKNTEETTYKVTSLHIGGLKARSGEKRNMWDGEKQRLTAMQWLVAYGLGKGGKKGKHVFIKGQDLFWSISSRIMADMWLKPIRNPDVKFTK